MTNEQQAIQIMRLDQLGFGGMTAEGEKTLERIMQAARTEECSNEESRNEYSYLHTRLIRSRVLTRTHA